MKTSGKVLFLDRSDINTDEIIPAKYLTETPSTPSSPTAGRLEAPGFDPKEICGAKRSSSRGPTSDAALARARAVGPRDERHQLVIAESFARIFRQNMFNCGMMAIELPRTASTNSLIISADTSISIDFDNDKLTITSSGVTRPSNIRSRNSIKRWSRPAAGWSSRTPDINRRL